MNTKREELNQKKLELEEWKKKSILIDLAIEKNSATTVTKNKESKKDKKEKNKE